MNSTSLLSHKDHWFGTPVSSRRDDFRKQISKLLPFTMISRNEKTKLQEWQHLCKPQLVTLRQKCPNTEVFLVRILPRLDLIRIFTVKISVFSLNTGKHGPEKNCLLWHFSCSKSIQKKISILRFHQIARENENPLELSIKNEQKETLSLYLPQRKYLNKRIKAKSYRL